MHRIATALVLLAASVALLFTGCGNESDSFPIEARCDDGKDDDLDGAVDCADTDCAFAQPCQTEHCYNLIDDDGNGETDCEDSGCDLSVVCLEDFEDCANGQDDDADGNADCDDDDCASTSICLGNGEDCENGSDDDGDGDVDCADSDCSKTSTCAPIAETCADSQDNDGDGDVDCDDQDCMATAECVAGGEDCTNGKDDDSDGKTDCRDTDCAHTQACLPANRACSTACVSNDDCAGNRLCFNGRCARDACDCVVCDSGEVCGRGACVPACTEENDCADDQRCFDGGCFSDQTIPNKLPKVQVGANRTVDEGSTVTLEGSAVDPDGTITATQWTQVSGPDVSLSVLGMGRAQFRAPTTSQTMELVFEFRAFDNEAGESAGEVTVTVEPITAPPTVDAGANFSHPDDAWVTLTGTATDDGTIEAYQWSLLSGPSVTFEDDDTAEARFLAPDVAQPTTLEFEFSATDDEGLTATDQVLVTLQPINSPPNVDAGTDQLLSPGTTVTLSATATDPNSQGNIASTTWTQVSGTSVALDDPGSLTTTFSAPASVDCVESLVFEIEAVDDEGAIATDRVRITVLASGTTPTTVPSAFDFEGTATEGISSATHWEAGSPGAGPAWAFSGANVWATNLDGTADGTNDSVLLAEPFDLRSTTSPILSFRMWLRAGPFNDYGPSMLFVQVNQGNGWEAVSGEVEPTYQKTLSDGTMGWTFATDPNYTLATVDLSRFAGKMVCARWVFRPDQGNFGEGPGAYIDDMSVHEESSDPDADGLMGIRGELSTTGTDPLLADSDDDGVADDVELADGTNPLNPADFAGAPVWTPGTSEDLNSSDGGLVPSAGLEWEHGLPTGGPQNVGANDRAWATDIDGGPYLLDMQDYLYLPAIDLTSATDPTFSAWVYNRTNGHTHGPTVQIRTGTNTWDTLSFDVGNYNDTAEGHSIWLNVFGKDGSYGAPYELAAASLQPYVGQRVELRIHFVAPLTSAAGSAPGAFFNGFSVYEESDDPDGDGALGVLNEIVNHGTIPWVADTDGDGVDDGTEINTDGTDPTDPISYVGAPSFTAPFVESFDDASGGGLVTSGTFWEFGAPSQGPASGYTGGRAWATNLTGPYARNSEEYLYLPPIDLSGVSDPTFTMRAYFNTPWWLDHGTTLEMIGPNGNWVTVPAGEPLYNGQSPGGAAQLWNFGNSDYTLVAVSLNNHHSSTARLRIGFHSAGGNTSWHGAYIDDIAVREENVDHDGDGLMGILAEYSAHGTDPFVADTDGDGVDDGQEVSQGTSPTTP